MARKCQEFTHQGLVISRICRYVQYAERMFKTESAFQKLRRSVQVFVQYPEHLFYTWDETALHIREARRGRNRFEPRDRRRTRS